MLNPSGVYWTSPPREHLGPWAHGFKSNQSWSGAHGFPLKSLTSGVPWVPSPWVPSPFCKVDRQLKTKEEPQNEETQSDVKEEVKEEVKEDVKEEVHELSEPNKRKVQGDLKDMVENIKASKRVRLDWGSKVRVAHQTLYSSTHL